MRARGGADVMEILVTHQSTGLRTRFSVPPTVTLGEIKTQGMQEIGMDYSWMQANQWCVSKAGETKAEALDEAKTAADYGISKGDEVVLWFTP